MHAQIKNLLGIAIILTILAFSYSAWKYVKAYENTGSPTTYRSFEVVGEGKVVSVPDIAQFSFSVISEGGTDIGKLQKDNVEKMNKALEFIKKNGVEAKDIQTTNYSINPRYETCQNIFEQKVCPPAKIVGYTIQQNVNVKVRNFDKIGEILGGVPQFGVNDLSQLNFTIDDPSGLQTEARGKAIKDAKKKAEQLAQSGGFDIGSLLAIEEVNYGGYYYDRYAAKSLSSNVAVEAAAPAPMIEPGSQEVMVQMRLRFEIQ